ncbi:MAG: MetQ/NlpA family ABC transporter substrate-binding protein [Candidatus Omnitrophica bacterium]|nr:MetQ/NlpA family ABC transporter substrate-binding protein [Candidatus Omnitrophota bacterium]
MNRKRILSVAVLIVAIVFGVISHAQSKDLVLVIGATPVPHAEILEKAKVLLAAKGVNLQIKVFTDYMTPNLALNDKSLDANYFQHLPYLEDFNNANKSQLVSAGTVHYEPLAIYSKKIKDLKELQAGEKVAIPNDVSNEARALILLQDNGIIKLKSPGDLNASIKDIASYSVKIELVEIEAAQLPRVLGSVSAAVINGNYAIDAGLSPLTDALASESSTSIAAKTYANLVAVRKGDEDRPEIKELLTVLHSDQIMQFIKERYKGAVIPIE